LLTLRIEASSCDIEVMAEGDNLDKWRPLMGGEKNVKPGA